MMNNRHVNAAIAWAAALLILIGHTAAAETAGGLQAGAAIADITPEVGVSLDGPISKNGPVTAVHDRLHARALVLAHGDIQLAIVVCDACMIGRDVLDAAKEIVHRQTGLPPARMLIAATHTHAAPRATHIGTAELDDRYHVVLAQKIAAAVVQARANLAPAQIGWTSLDKPDLIRCRRSLCEPGSVGANPFGETGERIKSVAGTSSAVIGPAGPVDPQFSILSVQHADGKPLAVLGNYSVHYCGGYQRGQVSADYFGHFAAALQADLNAGEDHPPFVGLMSNGTSGNTGAIERNGKSYPPFEWMKVSARILADETLRALKTIQYRRDLPLAMQETELALAVRKPSAERLAWARRMQTVPVKEHPHRWTSVYANEALQLNNYPDTVALKLQAIRIGDLAIAAIPCEVFAETGLQIKHDSPHQATFVMELANGYGGYLPPPEQHELGGYETWPARSSFLEIQAEPRIRAAISQLLHDVHQPVTLPDEIVAVAGIETAIYFDNIFLTKSPESYQFEVDCQVGRVESRRWALEATSADVGRHPLTVTVKDAGGQTIAAASTTLRILPAELGGGKHFRLLIVGDSLTHATAYPNEIARLFSSPTNPTCQMLGTHRPAAAAPGVAHEGYGGWTWQRFATQYEPEPDGTYRKRSSPFVFLNEQGTPGLDVARYVQEACGGTPPDLVVFMLGINDCFSADPDRLSAIDQRIDTMFTQADRLIDAFRSAAPRARLGICLTTPPNARQAAFEANYQDRFSRWGWKRIQHRLVQRQLERYASHADKHLFVIPTQLSLDPIDGYPPNNGVHPSAGGYRQIGRAIYASLLAQLADDRAGLEGE